MCFLHINLGTVFFLIRTPSTYMEIKGAALVEGRGRKEGGAYFKVRVIIHKEF